MLTTFSWVGGVVYWYTYVNYDHASLVSVMNTNAAFATLNGISCLVTWFFMKFFG